MQVVHQLVSIAGALGIIAGAADAQFAITRSTINGGGAVVTGGPYALHGTIGQPVVAAASGGSIMSVGGFWTATGACGGADVTTTGSSNGLPDGIVDLSDFSTYLSLWSQSNARADITATGVCAFSESDGSVDLSDFSCYLSEWSRGCP